MGKWSDGVMQVVEREGDREESDEVMTKSRVWLSLWVGKCTCWVRLNEESSERKWDVKWLVQLSTWILKSSVMINSWGVVAASDRKELNSSRKTDPYQPISSFSNAVNLQLNADASSEKIIHNGPILTKLYQPVLGVQFLWNTVYIWDKLHRVSKKFPPLNSL